MNIEGWKIESEVAAGEVWAAVATHAPVVRIDRTHRLDRLGLGLRLSPAAGPAHGRFLVGLGGGGFRRLGRIVATPPHAPLQVVSSGEPARRMLHCQVPDRVGLQVDDRLLANCLDLRDAGVEASLARLARETAEPGFATRAVVEGLGLLLGAEIARLVAGSAPRQPPHRGGLAAWQLKRIDDHLHAGHWDCTVTELASLCGLSASHTMRAFRQSVGRTLAAHIAEQRIARACDLLADGALSIAEIAQAVRFGGPSSFSAAFRRSMGTSPGRYRQRRRSS